MLISKKSSLLPLTFSNLTKPIIINLIIIHLIIISLIRLIILDLIIYMIFNIIKRKKNSRVYLTASSILLLLIIIYFNNYSTIIIIITILTYSPNLLLILNCALNPVLPYSRLLLTLLLILIELLIDRN